MENRAVRGLPRVPPLLSGVGLLALVIMVATRLVPATRIGFYNDDFLYLDAVARGAWPYALLHPLSVGGYLRPFSRDLHFTLAHALFGTNPLPYHWVNLLLVLASVALVWVVARRVCGSRGALLAASMFGSSHAFAVLVGWVSGVQDLWALVWALAATAWMQRRRTALSAVCFALALGSKESVALLPFVLVALDPPGGTAALRWKRCIPHFAILAVWTVWYASVRGSESSLSWNTGAAIALPWRFTLTALGIEGPRLWPKWLVQAPPLVPLLSATAVGLILWRLPRQTVEHRTMLAWMLWTVLMGIPILAVADQWSAYYFVLPLAGLCVAVGVGSEGWPGAVVAPLPLLLLISSQASIHVGFDPRRELDDPSISRVSVGRLFRGDHFARVVGSQLRAMLPSPPDSALFLMSGVPANNGLFSGDGPGIRVLYQNPTLASQFLGQVDAGTPFHRPLFLLNWDEDSERLTCAPVSPANFAHLPRVMELARHPEGAAAAADYEAAHLDTTPSAAWNAGYLHWEADDTAGAKRAWRLAASRLNQAPTRTARAARAPQDPRTRYLELQRALYGSPLDTTLLVAGARVAASFDTVIAANLYFRACYLTPDDTALQHEASPVLHRLGPGAAADYVDSLLARH
jgi:hypothetical protein